jgi:hypothetical protein
MLADSGWVVDDVQWEVRQRNETGGLQRQATVRRDFDTGGLHDPMNPRESVHRDLA